MFQFEKYVLFIIITQLQKKASNDRIEKNGKIKEDAYARNF